MMLFINCLFWLKNWRFSPNSRKGLLYPYFQWDKQFSLTANARKHFFLHFLFLVKNWIKTVLFIVSNVYLTERIYYTIGKDKGTRIFRVNLIWRFSALLKSPPATHVNLKTGVKRKQNTCVSRGSKCSCFGKFGVFFSCNTRCKIRLFALLLTIYSVKFNISLWTNVSNTKFHIWLF